MTTKAALLLALLPLAALASDPDPRDARPLASLELGTKLVFVDTLRMPADRAVSCFREGREVDCRDAELDPSEAPLCRIQVRATGRETVFARGEAFHATTVYDWSGRDGVPGYVGFYVTDERLGMILCEAPGRLTQGSLRAAFRGLLELRYRAR